MKHTFTLLLVLVALAAVAAAPALSAQVTLPVGDYDGSWKAKLSNCSDDDKEGGASFKGTLMVLTQVGADFTATGVFIKSVSGVDLTLDVDLMGTIDDSGNLMGTFTHELDLFFELGTGGGTFTGVYQPGKKLDIELDGEDDDGFIICDLTGPLKLKSPPGPFACDGGQLKAASKLCKSGFGCHSKFEKDPDKDPGGVNRDACLTKARDKFASSYQKAADKAVAKGGTCTSDDTGTEAGDAVVAGIQTVVDAVNGQTDDGPLRSTFLKEAGTMASKSLGAEAKNVSKPDLDKLGDARTKARDKFIDKTQKATDKAGANGVDVMDVDVSALADAVDAFVDSLLL